MGKVALLFCFLASVITASCTNTTVEEVGSFNLSGTTYLIISTTPGRKSEAYARDQATYSVEVEGENVLCNGSTSDCRAVTVQRLKDLAIADGTEL